MDVLFTLLFIATAYITPEVIFGPLTEYHIEVLLALLAAGFSLPAISRAHFLQAPQTYAFAVFCLAVPLSILAGASGWLGGATGTLYGFLPLVFCFVLTAATFRKAVHFRWLTAFMVLCSAFFIFNGLHDLNNHVIPSEFLYGDGDLRRLRGLGFVHDPNDFAQVLVSLLPMLFLWRTRSWLVTTLVLLPPASLLVAGMYFTHSRGGALALMATLIIALRRKVGTVPAVVLAGALFAASLAVGWSGGRDVSVEAGGDRLDAWSTGFEFIKQHPLFGVGAGRFADYNEITAHNSIVVCAAEIGLPGFVCWVFMIVASFRGAISVGSWKSEDEIALEKKKEGTESVPAARKRARAPSATLKPLPHLQYAGHPAARDWASHEASALTPTRGNHSAVAQPADIDLQRQIRGIARILVCSLTGFLVAGWFLSRAFSMWLFLYCGMAYAVVRMAEDAGMHPKRDSFKFLAKWSVLTAIGLLLLVYGILRFRNLTGR